VYDVILLLSTCTMLVSRGGGEIRELNDRDRSRTPRAVKVVGESSRNGTPKRGEQKDAPRREKRM
jgi:hypothetical protein